MLPNRGIYGEDHAITRGSLRRFIAEEIAPNFDAWEAAGIVDRSLWGALGANGFLCPTVPEEFGGLASEFQRDVGRHCADAAEYPGDFAPGGPACAAPDRKRCRLSRPARDIAKPERLDDAGHVHQYQRHSHFYRCAGHQ